MSKKPTSVPDCCGTSAGPTCSMLSPLLLSARKVGSRLGGPQSVTLSWSEPRARVLSPSPARSSDGHSASASAGAARSIFTFPRQHHPGTMLH